MRLEFATRDFQHILLSHFVDQNLEKNREKVWNSGTPLSVLKEIKVEFCRHDTGNIENSRCILPFQDLMLFAPWFSVKMKLQTYS